MSRVDTEVDKQLEQLATPERARLRGRVAIANAASSTSASARSSTARRSRRCAPGGCRVQRPLWASTSTKNPALLATCSTSRSSSAPTRSTPCRPRPSRLFADHGTGAAAPRSEDAGDLARQELRAAGARGRRPRRRHPRRCRSTASPRSRSRSTTLARRALEGEARQALADAARRDGHAAGRSAAVDASSCRQPGCDGSWTWQRDRCARASGRATPPCGRRPRCPRSGRPPGLADRAARRCAQHVADLAAFADEVRRAGIRSRRAAAGWAARASRPRCFGAPSVRPRRLSRASSSSTARIRRPCAHVAAPGAILREDAVRRLEQVGHDVGDATRFFQYFWSATAAAGGRLALRGDHRSRHAARAAGRASAASGASFSAPPDVGGRYSALTVFGLVPAALIGVDLREPARSRRADGRVGGGLRAAARQPGASARRRPRRAGAGRPRQADLRRRAALRRRCRPGSSS